MHRVNRCTLAGTAWARPAPTEPRPCAHCASIAYALLPAARVPLCRHRTDPESSSRSLPSGSPVRIALIAPTARIAPPPPPPRAAVRVPLSRCVGPGALAGKNRTACIPFSSNARKRPPSWQLPPEMHAFRDQDGNILALCIHFRAQSGDSGCMACKSCHQVPLFASRVRKSCMARRCCQRRPPRQPSPGAPAESSAHTRAPLPCRADSAAVPAIPVKWCGDTIAHTRKLRF